MSTFFRHLIKCALPVIVTALGSSCNMLEENADCDVTYQVKFVADRNIKSVDIFHQEVNSVSLYVFDEKNTFVMSRTHTGNYIHPDDGNYAMNITDLEPGKYHLVAWCDVDASEHFNVPELTPGVSTLEDLTCSLSRKDGERGIALVNTELDPLYHGMTDIEIPETVTEPGVVTFPIQMTKNTNTITVVLQQLNGEDLNEEDYEFVIEANNGHMNHDNSLLPENNPLSYNTWNQQSVNAEIFMMGSNSTLDTTPTTAATVVANMTIGRMMYDADSNDRPILTVYNRETGASILSVPLIDYALLVRNNYSLSWSYQEYLDRQDEYSLTFFLNNGKWVSSIIVVNSWRIVMNNDDINTQN